MWKKGLSNWLLDAAHSSDKSYWMHQEPSMQGKKGRTTYPSLPSLWVKDGLDFWFIHSWVPFGSHEPQNTTKWWEGWEGQGAVRFHLGEAGWSLCWNWMIKHLLKTEVWGTENLKCCIRRIWDSTFAHYISKQTAEGRWKQLLAKTEVPLVKETMSQTGHHNYRQWEQHLDPK